MAEVKFGNWSVDIVALSDAEFLRAIIWKSGTDKKLVSAASSENTVDFISIWIKHLLPGSKKKRLQWTQILETIACSKPTFPNEDGAQTPFQKLVQQVVKTSGKSSDKKKRSSVDNKIVKILKSHPEFIEQPLELLTALLILVESSKKLASDSGCKLFRLVLQSSLKFLETIDVPASDEHVSFDQRLVMAGELPWVISMIFSDLAGASAVSKAAKKIISEEVDARTDTDGTPQAELLERFPLWLASFVRCSMFADLFHVKLWKEDGLDRFENVVRRASGICQSNGRIALSNGVGKPDAILSEAVNAANLASKDPARISVETICSKNSKTKVAKNSASRLVPSKFKEENSPSTQSDWAQFATLRNNWSPGADCLAIAHNSEIPRMELSVFGTQLMAGEWNVDVVLDNEHVIPGEWACSCWNADKDGDYLELTTDLKNGWKLDRLIFLSRNDHFCFLMDCIVGSEPAEIQYQSLLPVVEHAKLAEDVATRSVTAKAGSTKTTCYPLDFPRDRVHSSPGHLKIEHGQLAVQHSGREIGLAIPLFLDWSPNRKNKLADWSSLTVVEEGEILPPGHATGHRIRVGKHQWLAYHALQLSGRSRSVLGLHTLHETVIGEFSTIGDVTPLLLVDVSE